MTTLTFSVLIALTLPPVFCISRLVMSARENVKKVMIVCFRHGELTLDISRTTAGIISTPISSREFNYSLASPIFLPSQRDRYIIPLRRGKQLAGGLFKRK